MANKKSSPSKQNYLKSYKNGNKIFTNRKKTLERHLKKFPNDLQAKKALKELTPDCYRRKKPIHSYWTKELKQHAHEMRLLGYNGKDALILKKPRIF